jgi:large subunit ribosomal protein L12
MNEVYAALILHEAKKEINEENIKKILEAAGVPIEEAKIKALVAALEGVNIDEILRQATTVQQQAAAVPQKEEKKEEEESKKRAEEAVAGLSALFG